MTRFASPVLAAALGLIAFGAAAQTPPAPAAAPAPQAGPAQTPPMGARPGGMGMGMGMGQFTLAGMQARQGQMFDAIDTDHDGAITGAELAALSQGDRAARGGGRLRQMLARADADGNGRITKDEVTAAAAARFAAMDKNGDGVLGPDERPQTPAAAAPMGVPASGGGMPPMDDPMGGG